MSQAQPTDERWSRFQDILQSHVSAGAWQTWLGRLEGDIEGDHLTLVAPSDFHLRWVMEKHGDAVEQAFSTAFGTQGELRFTTGEPSFERLFPPGSDIDPSHPAGTPAGAPGSLPTPEAAARLVRKYRFENFVVGQSNRFAWAAAMAVAEQPGNHYNPLFIYGGAGLGKTHLLNAIGHHALELYPGLTVRYISSEAFFNDFIDSIRKKKMDDFKIRYRTTDILLLDDVQFFEGKDQILEEFFHTFNELYNAGKQMVISSDRHPRNLATLEERLRSRFEWGLLTDIQPPDVETRLAILKRNAEFVPHAIPDGVLEFIAGLVSDNIRELEGALTRVTAFASLTGEAITSTVAEKVLQDLLPGHEAKAVAASDIIRVAAEAYSYAVDEVTGPSRRQPLVQCRQVAMYLCRELTDLSLPKIGAVFGGRDHTTVMYAIEKVQKLMQSDREVFDRVTDLSQSLRRTS